MMPATSCLYDNTNRQETLQLFNFLQHTSIIRRPMLVENHHHLQRISSHTSAAIRPTVTDMQHHAHEGAL
jgi:hypothetical protein